MHFFSNLGYKYIIRRVIGGFFISFSNLHVVVVVSNNFLAESFHVVVNKRWLIMNLMRPMKLYSPRMDLFTISFDGDEIHCRMEPWEEITKSMALPNPDLKWVKTNGLYLVKVMSRYCISFTYCTSCTLWGIIIIIIINFSNLHVFLICNEELAPIDYVVIKQIVIELLVDLSNIFT